MSAYELRISYWSSDVCSSDLPFYGFSVLCIDPPAVQKLIGRVEHRRIVTYGVSAQADYRAENIRVDNGGLAFDVEVTDHRGPHAARLDGLHLPMLGRHNPMNAITATAVARP